MGAPEERRLLVVSGEQLVEGLGAVGHEPLERDGVVLTRELAQADLWTGT